MSRRSFDGGLWGSFGPAPGERPDDDEDRPHRDDRAGHHEALARGPPPLHVIEGLIAGPDEDRFLSTLRLEDGRLAETDFRGVVT